MRDAFLDLLAGGTCVVCGRAGRRLCPWCAAGLRSHPRRVSPTPCPPGLVRVVAAGDYDGALRALVLAHKERSALGLAAPLGRLLADAVAAVVPPRAAPAAVLVPVPSHPAVVRGRGHDPVLRVARIAARVLRRRGVPVGVRSLLAVSGRPQDQSGLTAEQRRTNLAERFRTRACVRPEGLGPLLLVDDVMTTGATLREAQRALEAAGLRPAGAATLAATSRRHPAPPAYGPGLPVRPAGG